LNDGAGVKDLRPLRGRPCGPDPWPRLRAQRRPHTAANARM